MHIPEWVKLLDGLKYLSGPSTAHQILIVPILKGAHGLRRILMFSYKEVDMFMTTTEASTTPAEKEGGESKYF